MSSCTPWRVEDVINVLVCERRSVRVFAVGARVRHPLNVAQTVGKLLLCPWHVRGRADFRHVKMRGNCASLACHPPSSCLAPSLN